MKKLLLLGFCITLSLSFGNLFSQTIYVDENFNATGIPSTWILGPGGSSTSPDTSWVWVAANSGPGSNDLDGTGFMFISSDAAGSAATLEDTLFTPAFDGAAGSPPQIILEFEHYYRTAPGADSGHVEVFDGASWVSLASYSATVGGWSGPAQQSYDITAFANPNMQVRFRYNDLSVWAWYWAVDNVKIYAPSPDDVGVVEILAPVSGCGLGTMEQISIHVQNLGSVPIVAPLFIPVRFEVNGVPGPQEYIPVLQNLPPGDTIAYTSVTGYNMATSGTSYDIRAYTEYGVDSTPSNDTLGGYTITHNVPIITFPYTQTFDGPGFVPNNGNGTANTGGNSVNLGQAWSNDRNDSPQDWAVRSAAPPTNGTGPTSDHTSGSGNYIYTEDSSPFNYQEVNLLSPCFDVGALTCPQLSFWVSSFNSFGTVGTTNMLHVDAFYLGNLVLDITPPIGNLNTRNWQKFNIDLSGYTFGVIQFRFRVDNDNGTFSHDIAIDDVMIADGNNGDAELFSSSSPASGCLLSNAAPVTIQVVNNDCNTLSNIPVSYSINGGTVVNDIISANVNSGGTTTFTFMTPANLSAVGTYNFEIIVSNSFDQNSSNDTIRKVIQHYLTPASPTTVDDTLCGGANATLTATRTNGDLVVWYDSPTGGSPVGAGDILTVGPINSTTSYYAEVTTAFSDFMGPSNNQFGTGGNFNFDGGLVFDVLSPMGVVIETVDVYPNGPGNITVDLLDDQGSILLSRVVTVTGAGGAETIPLNFFVPAGTDYELFSSSSSNTTGGMYRNNSGSQMPYTIPGILSIFQTSNRLAGNGFYYFFYNWEVSAPLCSSGRTAAQAFIQPNGVDLAPTSSVTICGNDTLVLDAGPMGSSYLWNTGATTQTLAVTSPGTYSVDKVDVGGCMYADMVTVSFMPRIDFTIDSLVAPKCNGDSNGAILATGRGGTGALSYGWNNGGTTEDLFNIAAGNYTSTITDGAGCVLTTRLTLTEPMSVDLVTDVVMNPGCPGDSSGSISITPIGGTAPYTFMWSNGETTKDITNLKVGSYTVTIIDMNGCVGVSTPIDINPAIPITFNLDGSGDELCPGDNNGFIFISPLGGTAPFTYLWSNGATTADLTGLGSGSYSTILTDANGCVVPSDTFTINTLGVAPVADFNTQLVGGTVDFTNTSSDGASYSWDFGDGSPTLSVTDPIHTYTANGTYTVTLITFNDCGSDTTTQDIIMGSVGIDEQLLGANLHVYPNPSAGHFNISFTDLSLKEVNVTIFDIKGKQVYQKFMGDIGGSFVEEIELKNDLSEGVYVLQVRSERFVVHKRIVLSR